MTAAAPAASLRRFAGRVQGGREPVPVQLRRVPRQRDRYCAACSRAASSPRSPRGPRSSSGARTRAVTLLMSYFETNDKAVLSVFCGSIGLVVFFWFFTSAHSRAG